MPVRAGMTIRALLHQACGTGWPWGISELVAEACLCRDGVRCRIEPGIAMREGEEKVPAAWRDSPGEPLPADSLTTKPKVYR